MIYSRRSSAIETVIDLDVKLSVPKMSGECAGYPASERAKDSQWERI